MKGTANTRCYETIGARVHNIAYHIHNIVDHVQVQKWYFSPNSTNLAITLKKKQSNAAENYPSTQKSKSFTTSSNSCNCCCGVNVVATLHPSDATVIAICYFL